jgi:hypothetical protein
MLPFWAQGAAQAIEDGAVPRRVLQKSVDRIFLKHSVFTSLCDCPGRRASRQPPSKTRLASTCPMGRNSIAQHTFSGPV